MPSLTHCIYRRAAARPTAINRPPACLALAPPVKGIVLLLLGKEAPVDLGAAGEVTTACCVGDGVTVMTVVITVGTQVEIVNVERIGLAEGGGATTPLDLAGAEVAGGGTTTPLDLAVAELDGGGTTTPLDLAGAELDGETTTPLDEAIGETVEVMTLAGAEVDAGAEDDWDSVSVTGQMVVYKLMISVVTCPILAGQLVLESC
jgi:hypothetical protein